jgi:predicted Ser/Thr protein kinase
MKMDFNKLNKLNHKELKEIAVNMGLPVRRCRGDIIEDIVSGFKEYETYKREKIDKYTKVRQLGEKGKEGVAFLVELKNGEEFAMKTFRKQKSSDRLNKEANLQTLVANTGAAPVIYDIDTVSKYIVMDKMDRHLVELVEKQNGILTKNQQKQIILIYKKMDDVGVFHGDANLMNYMVKGKQIFIIDFGMAKEITTSLIKKLGTATPNINIMTLGFILKLRSLECSPESYCHMLKFLSEEQRSQFNL